VSTHKIQQDPQGKGYKMKKSELIAQVNEVIAGIKDKKLSEELSRIINEYGATKGGNKVDEHPPVLNKDGSIKELWCTKHLQYEPVELFRKSTRGATGYHYNCKVADAQWREITNKINETNKALSEALTEANFEEAAKLNEEKKSLEAERAAPYEYDEDIEAEINSEDK